MLLYKHTIENAGFITLSDNNIYYQSTVDNSLVKFTENGIQWSFPLKRGKLNIGMKYNNLFIHRGYSSLSLIDDTSGELLHVADKLAYAGITNRDNKIIVSIEGSPSTFGLFDTVAYDTKWVAEFPIAGFLKLIGENTFYTSKLAEDGVAYAFSINDGMMLWRHDTRQYGPFKGSVSMEGESILKGLAEYGGKCWIALRSGRILLLDQVNGDLIQILDGPFLNGGIIKHDTFQNKLVGLSIYTYYEIDMNSLEITSFNLEEYMKPMGLMLPDNDFIMDEKYIYFVDKRNNKVAVLDRQSKEIIWHYAFEEVGSRLYRMGVSNSLMTVEDETQKKIHVFERS